MLDTLIGPSPIPTLIGYLTGALLIAQEIIKDQGLPQDLTGWLSLVMAVGIALLGRSAKQVNVTNSPNPVQPHEVCCADLPEAPKS
jgi:hypothetical protein